MSSNEHLEQWDRLTCKVVRVQAPDAISQRIIRTGSYPNSAIIIHILQTYLEIETRVVTTSHGFLISPQTSVVELCPIESAVALTIANLNPQPNFPGNGRAKNLTIQSYILIPTSHEQLRKGKG